MMLDHLRIVVDAFIQADELIALYAKHPVRDLRHVGVIAAQMAFCKSRHRFDLDGQDMHKLAQQAADRVGHLSALTDDQVTRSVNGQNSPLLFSLNWNTQTFVAALRHDRLDAPWVIDGAMNRELFDLYVETQLVPVITPSQRWCHNPHSAKPARGLVQCHDSGLSPAALE